MSAVLSIYSCQAAPAPFAGWLSECCSQWSKLVASSAAYPSKCARQAAGAAGAPVLTVHPMGNWNLLPSHAGLLQHDYSFAMIALLVSALSLPGLLAPINFFPA
jgi:hypothetical protein